MYKRDIFGQTELGFTFPIYTSSNIVHSEVTCPHCKSVLSAEGTFFVGIATPGQTRTCPVCGRNIYFSIGFPPRNWAIVDVLKREEPAAALLEPEEKPLFAADILFKQIKCPYCTSDLELKGTWKADAGESTILCPACGQTFSFGPTVEKPFLGMGMNGQKRIWELARLIEAKEKIQLWPLSTKIIIGAVGAIAAVAVIRGIMKKI